MDEEYPVTPGLEMPAHRKRAESKYKFERLKIGDSFPVKPEEVLRVRAAGYVHGKTYFKRFSVRIFDKEDGTFEWRCWRTE